MRRIAVATTIVAASALLLTACGSPSASPSSAPVSGGTLVYATGDAEPTCLDPHVGGNYPQALVATQYLEQLVSKNSKGNIIPWLATSWKEASDGLSWEFTLKHDVTFTDGTPLTADAIAANIAHVQDPATASSTGYLALQKVTKVEVLNTYTARVDLSSPDSALLDSLSQPWLAIESPTALKRTQDVNCASPVGTGPYKVVKWNRQDSIELTRNNDYDSPPADAGHTGKAYIVTIDWRFIPDSASRYAALQSGAVDVIDNVQPETIVAARSSDSIKQLDAPRPGASDRLELNSSKGPFDDEKVREAFIRSADVDAAVKSLFFGTTKRSYSTLSSIEKDGLSLPDLFTYDQKQANTLLDQAGWTGRDADGYRTKDGKTLELTFPVSTNQSIPAEQSLFEQIQASTKLAGFKIDLEPMDLASWYAALGSGDYDLVSAPYTKVGPDVLRILYDSAGTVPSPSGYFANHAEIKDPALDALLEGAVSESDATKRAADYKQAQQIVLGGYYVLPLYDQQNHYLYRTEVKGFRALPSVSTPTFYDAWLARS